MIKQRQLLHAAAIFAAGLALFPARGGARDARDANSLVQALLDGAPRHVPRGYSGAGATRVALEADDRRRGVVAAVQVALGSRSAAGDGVTLQLIDGGRSKFDFDRGCFQRAVAVAGVGDDAFAFVSQAGFVQLYFIKGAGYASVTLQNSRDANRLESAKALARKIAARM